MTQRRWILRNTGSTACVVKMSLVKHEQMTGSCELCMLIDKVVTYSRFRGTAEVLCMETPVQDIIIDNISGALGTDAILWKA